MSLLLVKLVSQIRSNRSSMINYACAESHAHRLSLSSSLRSKYSTVLKVRANTLLVYSSMLQTVRGLSLWYSTVLLLQCTFYDVL
jgi:hypothetical protein